MNRPSPRNKHSEILAGTPMKRALKHSGMKKRPEEKRKEIVSRRNQRKRVKRRYI
jgi:hypothetical protein